jgi:hypothetical protein
MAVEQAEAAGDAEPEGPEGERAEMHLHQGPDEHQTARSA